MAELAVCLATGLRRTVLLHVAVLWGCTAESCRPLTRDTKDMIRSHADAGLSPQSFPVFPFTTLFFSGPCFKLSTYIMDRRTEQEMEISSLELNDSRQEV